jgi:phosphoribosyl-AMP cyclohydrolase
MDNTKNGNDNIEVGDINFDKMNGLVPAIIQDHLSHQVLMVGYMNLEAFERTIKSDVVTFFSRTNNKLWTKGETSGNFLKVISMTTDCDMDTILIEASTLGEGNVCHEGTVSCFTKPIK